MKTNQNKTKKNLFPLIFVIITILAIGVWNSYHTKKINPQESLQKVMTFEKATYTKSIVSEKTAYNYPGTFIFILIDEKEEQGIILLSSLPKLSSFYDTTLAYMKHGNVSLVEVKGQVYGIMPKHVFEEKIDIEEMLRQRKFSVSSSGDIVIFKASRKQKPLVVDLLDKLDPEKLDGAPCTINTLNCYKKDFNLYQYQIKGTLHYLTQQEQDYLFKNAWNSYGERVSGPNTEGMYLVRVPDLLFNEIPGMSGGSVVVNIEGKDYFLGLNTQRMRMISLVGEDTNYITLIGIQPVLTSDILKE